MTIEIDGKKVTVFDKKGKKLDLRGIISMEIRATGGKPTEAIFTVIPDHVTIKDVTRASIQELEEGLMKEFMEKWEKENNPFYPNEMRWDKVKINQMLSAYEQQKQTSDNSDYAMAVKKLIKSDVDCVQTKNGAYVNLDGVFDCLNRAL